MKINKLPMKTKKGRKHLLIRTCLFLSPVLVLLLLELFIFPIDRFTFRAWETLMVKNQQISGIIGPFYPNRRLEINEFGELAPHTPYAVKRKAVWYTDQYGYRNRNSSKKPEIVIIGDSQITGVKLTQEEILSEVLSRKLNKHVYSFAPGSLEEYMYVQRFKDHTPGIVIVARTERNFFRLEPINHNHTKLRIKSWLATFALHKAVSDLLVTADRAEKFTMFRSLKKAIDRKLYLPEYYYYGGEFFIQGEEANKDVPQEEVNRLTGVLENYKRALEERGSQFIFLPVPNKENIYHRLLPSGKKLLS